VSVSTWFGTALAQGIFNVRRAFISFFLSFLTPEGVPRRHLRVPFYCQASLLDISRSIVASLLTISEFNLASLLNISNSNLASLLTVSQSILPSVWLIVHFNASAAITVSNT